MCGIAGFVGPSCDEVRAKRFTNATLDAQHSRGPDDRGVNCFSLRGFGVMLGHNRLSIVDLSHAGHQPMSDISKRYTITFNGEIYNYKELRRDLESLGATFATRTDTEVILEAYKQWGIEALSRLNGMFAFAILDQERQVLTLARDRFGVKPLYFVQRGDIVAFASSARPLAREFMCSPSVDYVTRGAAYMVYEDGSHDSPFDGVRSLRPGSAMIASVACDRLTVSHHRYYDLAAGAVERADAIAGRSPQAILDELHSIFGDAVALRLRADVPVAVSLSGGLDSSSVAAAAATRHGRIAGFCYGSPDDARSEGPVVQRFAALAQIDATFVWPTFGHDGIADAFERTLRAQEGPIGGSSVIAQHLLFRSAHEHGFKVMLGGQGGDESYMGYRKFALFALSDAWRRGALGEWIGASVHLSRMLLAEAAQVKTYWHERHRYFGRAPSLTAFDRSPPQLRLGLCAGESLAQRQMRDALEVSLPTLLRYEDGNSMDNSVESRLPFVDYRLVELGLALPTAMKLNNGFGKWCLREIARDTLPKEIQASRLKRGFDVTQDWITHGLGAHLRQRVAAAAITLRDILRQDFNVETAFNDESLRSSPQSFAEATGLIWLADQL